MTPHEAWFKRKPNVSHLRIWGCLAYVFIQKTSATPFNLTWRNVSF
jgi:hypothetical protein